MFARLVLVEPVVVCKMSWLIELVLEQWHQNSAVQLALFRITRWCECGLILNLELQAPTQ